MIFLTYWFWVFAALFFPLYWAVRRPQARKLVLVGGCLAFHAHFAGPAGMAPIIFLGAVTYIAGRSRRVWACLGAIGLAVAALIFYKYSLFLAQQILGAIWLEWGSQANSFVRGWLPAAPPLAVSFFVFEFAHYLYEVRKGGEPIRSVLDFSLFSIFWPSLVAGPIKRYTQFLPSLEEGVRKVSARGAASGLFRAAIGYAKKVAADNLTVMLAFHEPRFEELGGGGQWLFLAGLGLRIYLDFSGYSDLAIGFARMAGVTLPENFDWPYLSRNLLDFWRRWHISLSTWIRDYVYFPLGGLRSPFRRVLNAVIAFALCGLWHGAGWNFLLWGLYHGAGVVATAAGGRLPGTAGAALRRAFSPAPVAWAATTLYVFFGWLMFFYPVERALHMARLLATSPAQQIWKLACLVLGVSP